MTHDGLDKLLWERIDREIRPEDEEELRQRLERDPEARARARQLDELVAALATVEDVTPPAALRQRIDAAMTGRRQSAPSAWSVASWVAAVRDLWRPAPLLRYGLLAAAFLIGVISYHLVAGTDRSSSLDPAKLYGTSGLAQRASPAGALILELPDQRGWLALHRQGSVLVAELALSSPGDGELSLRFAQGGFRLETLEHLGSPPGRLRSAADALELELLGPCRYTLTTAVGDPQQEIEIRLSTKGVPPLARRFRLADVPER